MTGIPQPEMAPGPAMLLPSVKVLSFDPPEENLTGAMAREHGWEASFL